MFCRLWMLPVLAFFLGGCTAIGAYQAILAEDYEQAAARYAAEIRADPGNVRNVVLYGYSLYKGGHCQEAYDALMPLAEDWRVGSYASFWAGLAALRLEDSVKFRAAWSVWNKAHPKDFETMRIMDDGWARLSGRDLIGYGFLADEIERDMNAANAKDDHVRSQSMFRGGLFDDGYPYNSLTPLPPKPYLP